MIESGRPDQQNALVQPKGPHPSIIQVAKPFLFEHRLREAKIKNGLAEPKESVNRIAGVTYIDNVRKALSLPVKTFHSAAMYYHKFRLTYQDTYYDYRDAAVAALFSACKIEDTLKKSKDILCAAYNMKLSSPAEYASPDDSMFEGASRTVVGIERLMLEACAFDFRSRHPHNLLMKMIKICGYDKDSVGFTAYKMHLDLYRTFAPLKHTTQSMAIACLELAARFHGADLTAMAPTSEVISYHRWSASRGEVMEAMNDLLDLYTDHRTQTSVGPDFPVEKFLEVRIGLNQEAAANGLPRFLEEEGVAEKDKAAAVVVAEGASAARRSPKEESGGTSGVKQTARTEPASGARATTREATSPQSPSRTNGSIGERGKDGTVRFMLDAERATAEKAVVKEYFRMEEIEEYVEQ